MHRVHPPSPEELALLADLMRRLAIATPLRKSRRTQAVPNGKAIDLRATLRRARTTGGHPLRLMRREPKRRPRRLVVLCDISGSMEPYARAMLQLLYCAAGTSRAEVFTFATRLTKVLARSRPAIALERAGRAAPDWSDGTRIGAGLKQFNDHFGQRGLARGAVVLIVSDGWNPATPRRSAGRWPACPGSPTGSYGSTYARRARATSRWSAGWRPRGPSATPW